MTAAIFAIFDWFNDPKNKWALYIVLGIVAIFTLKWYGVKREMDGAAKQKAKDAKATIHTVQVIQKESRHDAQVAIEAGANAPRLPPDGNTHSLPESVQSRIFRD